MSENPTGLKKDSWETGEIINILNSDETLYNEARIRADKRGAAGVKAFVYRTSILQDMQATLNKGERVLRRQIDWEEIALCLKQDNDAEVK